MALRAFQTKGEFFGVLLAAFVVGVAVHSVIPFTRVSDWWIAGIVGFVLLWAQYFVSRTVPLAASLVVLACLAGFWRFNATVPSPADGMMPWVGRGVTIEGTVGKTGTLRTQGTMNVEVSTVGQARIHGPGTGAYVRTVGAAPEVGTRVRFFCIPRIPLPQAWNPQRKQQLSRKGVWTECASAVKPETLQAPNPWNPSVGLARLREWLTGRIRRALPPEEAELAAGILYGDQDLPGDLAEQFRKSGLMHIVAVSGSNVTIVVDVFLFLALSVGLHRRKAMWVVAAALATFVCFVGFGASVLRAAAMGFLALLARRVGRFPWIDRLLLVSAATLTLWNPWYLAFDPGFALSFLAMWGLLAWTPIFEERCQFLTKRFGIREAFTMSAGATLMTAPYMAWAFGRMSLAGLFTNVLALPLVPWTMLSAAACAAWGSLPGSAIVSAPAFGFTRLIIAIAGLADFVPWLDAHVPSMDVFILAGTYVLIWKAWRGMRKNTCG